MGERHAAICSIHHPGKTWGTRTVTLLDSMATQSARGNLDESGSGSGSDSDFNCAPNPCTSRLQLQERIVELERLVSTDCLTGLWNRAHFERLVEAELDRSLRYRQTLSLILIDIDHFKRANDLYGHQAGDTVLRELALVANASIRSSDALFRWGGEEFAVLASSTGYRGAGRLAETIRGRVAQHSFPGVGRITASLGVAEHDGAESAEEWFHRADAMLYAAKEAGRDRVHIDARGNSDAWAADHGPASLCLVWQEAYECGEPDIDREHRELFNLANALIQASITGEQNLDRIGPALESLIDHVARHFSHEETLLEQHGYARLPAHRRAHAGLLGRANELKAAVANGQASLGSMVEFLAKDVVARHLFGADRDFFPLYKSGAARRGTAPDQQA